MREIITKVYRLEYFAEIAECNNWEFYETGARYHG